MGSTASGFVYPDTGYTSGVRQAIEDLADSAEDVIREAGIPRYADAAARNAALPAPTSGSLSALATERFIRRATGSGTTWKPYGSGLLPIIPTSVAGSGVALGSDGAVTATAATTISLNGCFSTDFDNYLVVVDFSATSAAADVLMRVRASGTDLSTGTYMAGSVSYNSTTPAYTYNASATSIITIRSNGTGGGGGDIKVKGPYLAQYTKVSIDMSDAAYIRTGGATVKNTTLYDGFTLYPDAAQTLTGIVRVYGYNNG